MGEVEQAKCDFCQQEKSVQRTYLRPSKYVKSNTNFNNELYNGGDYFIIVRTCSSCGVPKQDVVAEPSWLEKAKTDFVKEAFGSFDNKLKNYVKDNLKLLGFTFENESDFIEFVKKRVTRVGMVNVPHEWRLFVDCGTPQQRFIENFNDKINFVDEESTFKIIIGKLEIGKKDETRS